MNPSRSRSIALLTKARNQIPDLRELTADSPRFYSWRRATRVSIQNVFGDNSGNLKEFQKISYRPRIPPVMVVRRDRPPPRLDNEKAFEAGLGNADWLLNAMIEEIEEHWPEDESDYDRSGRLINGQLDSNRIFVVHGRDVGARETVARAIEQLELEVVILEEQPNKGRTVISKFKEEAADIGFAVVLLTPDDEGKQRGDSNEIRPRARQNVVLELGYFLAALGQRRVCALVKGDLEIPSDYDGVVYIPMDDSRSWKFLLVKELSAAGFKVDANRLLKTDKENSG